MARFTAFELLLLKSRSQVDTAVLLLLAWIMVHREHISEGQRRRRLAQVTAQFRHGHELGPVIGIARSQDLHAIQLAAEVVRKECSKERSLSVMHQAITVATDDGEVSLTNHYILRFLADLLNVVPQTFDTLFHELTGVPLRPPEDPSRDAYWQRHDPEYHARKANDANSKKQQEQRHQQDTPNAKSDKTRADERAHQQERARQERRQQEQARQEQARQEQARQEQARQEQARKQYHQRTSSSPPPDRTTRALAVLGLPPGATRMEVRRAYRRMAQLHHPDRFYSESEHQVALASARFQRIKNAYDYLTQHY